MDEGHAAAFIKAELARWPQCFGWSIGWSRSRKRLGETCYSTRRIVFSRYFVREASPADLLDTIRHEVAHVIAGYEAKHGPEWKRACELTGAAPVSCKSARTGKHWIGVCQCPNAFGGEFGKVTHRRRSSPPSPTAFCRRCGTLIQWVVLD